MKKRVFLYIAQHYQSASTDRRTFTLRKRYLNVSPQSVPAAPRQSSERTESRRKCDHAMTQCSHIWVDAAHSIHHPFSSDNGTVLWRWWRHSTCPPAGASLWLQRVIILLTVTGEWMARRHGAGYLPPAAHGLWCWRTSRECESLPTPGEVSIQNPALTLVDTGYCHLRRHRVIQTPVVRSGIYFVFIAIAIIANIRYIVCC